MAMLYLALIEYLNTHYAETLCYWTVENVNRKILSVYLHRT